MSVERIELALLELPYVHFFETSFGREEDRTFILVKVFADGEVGYGEVVADKSPLYSYETTSTAWLVLKEPMGIREWLGAGLVVVGVSVMGYLNRPLPEGQKYALESFLHVMEVAAVIFLPLALIALKVVRWHGLVFGAIVGTLIGIAMILGDMALVKSGGSFLGQFRNPFSYLALLCGVAALALTQFAFWRAAALVVVPTINLFIILVPVVIEYFTFGIVLHVVQYLAVVLIVLGVILLTMGSPLTHPGNHQGAMDNKEGNKEVL